MGTILEFERVGYDSAVSEADLKDYQQTPAVVQRWLDLEPSKRFSLESVKNTVGFTIDSFGREPEDEDSPERKKFNFCTSVAAEIEKEGTKAQFFALLENFKKEALRQVLKNERALRTIRRENFEIHRLDEMVIFQVLGFFMEYFDTKKEPKIEPPANPLAHFSRN